MLHLENKIPPALGWLDGKVSSALGAVLEQVGT